MDLDETSDSVFRLPDRAVEWLGELINENFTVVAILSIAAIVLWVFGVVSIPSLGVPVWIRTVVLAAVIAIGVGYIAATMHFSPPEPDWRYIVAINLDNDPVLEIHKVTDAVLRDLLVVGEKPITNPDGTHTYVCRWFNGSAENPVAITTWKDIPADWELLGTKPSSIEAEVASLRSTYEDTHGKYRWILDNRHMVFRKLDFKRSRDRDHVIEDHLSPSFDGDRVSDVLDEIIPDDVRPDREAGAGLEDDDQLIDVDEDEPIPKDDHDNVIEDVRADVEQMPAADGGDDGRE